MKLPPGSILQNLLLMTFGRNQIGNPELVVRATLEGQFLNMQAQSAWMGVTFSELRVTGGASKSKGICQVIANVFGCPVSRLKTTGSAGIGASMMAACTNGSELSALERDFCQTSETIMPNPEASEIYASSLKGFKELLDSIF